MAFFDNVKGKLTQASQTTVQKAKDISEIAKLNTQVLGAEKQINELYGKLGYEVYCAFSKEPLPQVEELINQLNDLHANINSWKEQIKAISAVETCPQCGAKLGKDMMFCSNCGHKLAPTPEVEVAPVETAFCSNCGASVPADAAFCTSCGNKMG